MEHTHAHTGPLRASAYVVEVITFGFHHVTYHSYLFQKFLSWVWHDTYQTHTHTHTHTILV